jgi:hypothetical protein
MQCGIRLCAVRAGMGDWLTLRRRGSSSCSVRTVPGAGEVLFGYLTPGEYLLSLGGHGRIVRLLVCLPPEGRVAVRHDFCSGASWWRELPRPLRPCRGG